MYGMVHKAARAMALEKFGTEFLDRVLERCGLGDEHFISSEIYDDETTLSLVAALSEESGLPTDELLTAFGQYWIKFATQSSYRQVMAMTGSSLDEFLANLDRMHAGIESAMPGARMPSFELVGNTGDSIDVIYRSSRAGLEPFVKGLMMGVLTYFGEKGDVELSPAEDGTLVRIRRRAELAA